MTFDWGALLVAQLEFYWEVHLRPRLEGLSDEEYFWEPVEGCWSLHRGEDGRYALDGQWPPPVILLRPCSCRFSLRLQAISRRQ